MVGEKIGRMKNVIYINLYYYFYYYKVKITLKKKTVDHVEKKKKKREPDHWTLVCCEGKMRREKKSDKDLWARVIRWDR